MPVRSLLILSVALMLVGCNTQQKTNTTDHVKVTFSAGDFQPVKDWKKTGYTTGGLRVWMSADAAVDQSRIVSAEAGKTDSGTPAVYVSFDDIGANQMLRLSNAQMSRLIVIEVNGKIVSAPVVLSPIQRSAVIIKSPDAFTQQEAKDLADALNRQSEHRRETLVSIQ